MEYAFQFTCVDRHTRWLHDYNQIFYRASTGHFQWFGWVSFNMLLKFSRSRYFSLNENFGVTIKQIYKCLTWQIQRWFVGTILSLSTNNFSQGDEDTFSVSFSSFKIKYLSCHVISWFSNRMDADSVSNFKNQCFGLH